MGNSGVIDQTTCTQQHHARLAKRSRGHTGPTRHAKTDPMCEKPCCWCWCWCCWCRCWCFLQCSIHLLPPRIARPQKSLSFILATCQVVSFVTYHCDNFLCNGVALRRIVRSLTCCVTVLLCIVSCDRSLLVQISRGQAPKASPAGSGERRWLSLELRLVADVGLVRRGGGGVGAWSLSRLAARIPGTRFGGKLT